MAPHSSTLAWKIPWTEEPGRLQSVWSLRVGHDWATSLSLFTFMHLRRKWQPTPVFLPGESQGWGTLVSCRLRGRTVGHDWTKWMMPDPGLLFKVDLQFLPCIGEHWGTTQDVQLTCLKNYREESRTVEEKEGFSCPHQDTNEAILHAPDRQSLQLSITR